ncbi:MAG: exodeoxyribonuclease V subunit beta [Chlorobiaceae bacterium]|nr:exodeoxyribonuclease V subunit beta [Chlorobiaceae bacterium]
MNATVLDHASVALTGMNLIEASAGTGKTYAITSLYLRLLLESELTPEQILVVTYTEAATRELREKIRRRIREALDTLQGSDTQDLFLSTLRDRVNSTDSLRHALRTFEAALAAFDTASIFTIHAFCLRALQGNAFESGSLYDTELMTDQSPLIREVADDFWRLHFFTEESPLLEYAIGRGWSADSLMKLLVSLHITPLSTVLPSFTEEEIASIKSRCRTAFEQVARIWTDKRQEIAGLLLENKSLSRAEGAYRQDVLDRLIDHMDRFIQEANPYGLFPGFERFTSHGIREGTKAKSSPPSHEFFDLCENLQRLVDLRLTALKAELLAFFRQRLPERKKEGNLRFFDDLLEDLYHALCSGDRAESLVSALRNRYRAALIDEFQDTDPVQYEIFRKIYAGTMLPLFLIGDPKQAIYSFRGADIFAYLQASRDVREDRRFTLVSNWRSDPLLLEAFNLFFEDSRKPFVFDDIEYRPLVPGRCVNGEEPASEAPAPLEICFLESNGQDGSLNSGEAMRYAAGTCARQIQAMLPGGAESERLLIGDRAVNAGDIAVIVRTHRQARAAQAALSARGIASVMRSDETVFASMEAEEIRILISALAEPARQPLVRSALATRIIGLSGNDIDRLNSDEDAWIARLQQFREYRRIWQEQGIMVMASALMSNESVRERLLSAPGNQGERALTNVLHCFELLHRITHERSLGIESLVAWFSERVAAKEPGEEYQIRLESDEPAVRIVTVHVSKGLEYPVVFCPFLFGGITSAKDVVQFHDDKGRLVKDFGSPQMAEHRAISDRESLAENLRLLYVALTRARHRCVLFTGRVVDGRMGNNGSPMLSPASYLVHVSADSKCSPSMLADAVTDLEAKSADAMCKELQMLADRSSGAIGFRKISDAAIPAETNIILPVQEELPEFTVRRFEKQIEHDWRVASFTAFSRLHKASMELPDRDEHEALVSVAPEQSLPVDDRSIFSFPRGARAGILMHALFENLPFHSATESVVHQIVEQELARHGFDESWTSSLEQMVHEVISIRFSSPSGTFSLKDLKASGWLTELEFHLPLKRITAPELGMVLARHGALQPGDDLIQLAESLEFQPVKGVLMGFMDMVFEADGRFWLVDWKSNHLGNVSDDYHYSALQASMAEHRYRLQYLLYTVALDRYLSMRKPKYRYAEHFGGVIYIYLRGVRSENGESTGIFRDLPSESLVRELAGLLSDHKGDAS